jgi:segregation and condensation protein B
MSMRGKIEAIIYAAEEPVTVDHIAKVLLESETIAPAEGEAPLNDKEKLNRMKAQVREVLKALEEEYTAADRGMEVRHIAGGYRMSTKPEHHDVVRAFARSLKAPVRLSLQALETLAVIAYKQPVTAPEISEIRGVDCSSVLGTLIDRKLITTAGRKQVIGRPIQYKTTKDFLLRFGLKDVTELPSVEEFEKLGGDPAQPGLFAQPVADATGVPDVPVEETAGAPSTES